MIKELVLMQSHWLRPRTIMPFNGTAKLHPHWEYLSVLLSVFGQHEKTIRKPWLKPTFFTASRHNTVPPHWNRTVYICMFFRRILDLPLNFHIVRIDGQWTVHMKECLSLFAEHRQQVRIQDLVKEGPQLVRPKVADVAKWSRVWAKRAICGRGPGPT